MGRIKRQFTFLCWGQMLRCYIFFKSLSLAIIYCRVSWEGCWACLFWCWSEVKRLAQGHLCNSCWWRRKKKESRGKFLLLVCQYFKYLCVFPINSSCVTLTCFLQCPMRTKAAAAPIMLYILPKQLLSINKRVLIMSYYTRIALMTLENIPPSVVVIIARWNVDINENDADVENIWP